ncbi:TPA: pilin [Photobacterium damselae]
MKGQKGFTLIELMIVVAVIGLLSAIAIPKYQEFAKKGAVASGMATLSGLKTNIEAFVLENGKFPTASESAAVGIMNSTIGNLAIMTSASGAKFTFTSGATSGASMAMIQNTEGWTCTYNGGSISNDLKVAGCTYSENAIGD